MSYVLSFDKRLLKKSLLIILLQLFSFNTLVSQTRTISGTVRDSETGSSLVGVTIKVPETIKGVVTDIDGGYSLEVDASTQKLIFSYVGYFADTISITGITRLDVSLVQKVEELGEVVVIGYGTVKKSDLTGSVSSVKAEDLVKVPVSNVAHALQGKVSGLSVLSASGDPGAAPVVRLRGITTLNNNNPIFVVDGVITDDIGFLNANDIQSVEVLKDASSTAIFGSRGSNGVIIITTKGGESGNPRIHVSLDQGWESIENPLEMMNREEFTRFYNAIKPGRYTNIGELPDIDWQREIFQPNTPVTNFNASVSGKNDNFEFYLGGGYFHQEGIVPKSSFSRFSAKLNSVYGLRNYLDVGLNVAFSFADKENAPNLISTIYQAFPIDAPINDADGSFNQVRGSVNPLASIEYNNSNTLTINTLGNVFARLKLLEGLYFRSAFQFDVGANKGRSFIPQYYVAPLQQNARSFFELSYGDRDLYILEQTLSYNKEFTERTRLDAIAGFTSQTRRSEFLNTSTKELFRESPDFWYINAGNPDFVEAGNSAIESSMISYLFRVNYVFDSRYLFTGTYRLDGSSNFGSQNRYGSFPSAAFGWNISQEEFFPKAWFIENLKLRVSYGLVGNEKIMARSQYETIGSGQGAVFGTDETLYAGASYAGAGNSFLRWETTRQFNAGLNIGLFENRLTAEIDYYNKNTGDILVFLRPSAWTGLGPYSSVTFNAADVMNSGLEAKLEYRENIGKLYIEVGLLGTTLHNEVTNLAENIGADSLIVSGNLNSGGSVSRTMVGYPIGFFYGYEIVGVFQNEAQLNRFPSLPNQTVGDFIYRDANLDGNLDVNDRVYLGSSIPDYIFGFNISARYKAISINADIQGQFGNKIYNGKQVIRFSEHNFEKRFNNFWTGPGSTDEHPRPAATGLNYSQSDYYVEDGSFLRLRTLTLNYAIPGQFFGQMSQTRANVYIRANNLFTLTKFTGYSPEIGADNPLAGSIDTGLYPVTRVFSVGFNLTL